ncbi:MAG: hypothetical protein LBQ61_06455 [Spirochaetales bacterium]|jgi:hypothetical protein|nr:hypothetical protein [Spirochaetales bacterium]
MKKLGIAFLSLFVFFLFGCMTVVDANLAVVFDPTVPEEESSYIGVPAYVTVKRFDTTEVSWKGRGTTATTVRIPSGQHTLVADVEVPDLDFSRPNPVYRNQRFEFNFEAGKTYYLRSNTRDGQILFEELEQPGVEEPEQTTESEAT